MRRILWGVLVAGVVALPVRAEDKTFACQRDDVVRNVLVTAGPDSAHACEVRYQRVSEGGAPQLLWHAQSDPKFCDSQAKTLVTRLEEAGWSCTADGRWANAEPKSVPLAAGQPAGITAAIKADPTLMKMRPTLH